MAPKCLITDLRPEARRFYTRLGAVLGTPLPTTVLCLLEELAAHPAALSALAGALDERVFDLIS